MTRSRREFLRDATRAGAALAAASAWSRSARAKAPAPGPELPAVIATWDYGVELCAAAQRVLAGGGDLLDALERGVNVVEDDPKVTSVGFGGLPNEDGVVQLDAAIMDGRTHQAGAVAALERIKNPISVARKVMERTKHVLLVGAGALQFARKMGFHEQDLLTPESRAKWEKHKESFWRSGERHDTVACIGIDARGNLATCVSTSGLPWKLAGRVGDSPLIGAGSYCDNEVGGAAATGIGELAIRNCASFAIVERMRAGVEPTRACEEILERVMKKHPELRSDPRQQLAFIALDKRGRHGAAVVRKQEKMFRYALVRGTKAAPVLTEVKPMVSA
ncbi:MAG TPA: N(4)-(beta-N-acetylglucosaminyl)-L-asparaginase [Polyangia bacterium]|nr:N(4)-(beta-N-acetylglucosaminyl)-L-asparaginase [Polyangia bacterium]